MRRPSSTLRFFGYTHLPQLLQAVSKPFHELAIQLEGNLPEGPEKSVALRKLLEAKDAAVRTMVKPLFITLKMNVGEHKLGDYLEVNHVVHHGGHSDDSKQYVLMDGTHVLESSAVEGRVE